MDYRIKWSPEAVEDVESIAEYIDKDSPAYAKAVVTKIFHLAKSLAENPYIGRIVPEMDDYKIRERFLYSYRLIYKVEPNEIIILAVIHGKRLLENFYERF